MSNVKKLAALLALCATIAGMSTPACLVPLDPSGGTGGGSSAGVGGGADEAAALGQALANADPEEVARMIEVAAYAAVETASLIEANAPDPMQVDNATFEALFAQYSPMAVDDAKSWIASNDPGYLSDGAYPKYECLYDPYNCPNKIVCEDHPDWRCIVTQCGKGTCPWCPEKFGNLVIKAWCAYGCLQAGTSTFVGGAYVLRSSFDLSFITRPFCFPK